MTQKGAPAARAGALADRETTGQFFGMLRISERQSVQMVEIWLSRSGEGAAGMGLSPLYPAAARVRVGNREIPSDRPAVRGRSRN